MRIRCTGLETLLRNPSTTLRTLSDYVQMMREEYGPKRTLEVRYDPAFDDLRVYMSIADAEAPLDDVYALYKQLRKRLKKAGRI